MTGYRTHISIIADILDTAREYSYEEGDSGATVTHLIRRANVPHRRLSSLVSTLKASGLLQELPEESRYRISEKGMEFLKNYRQFKGLVEGFGLRV